MIIGNGLIANLFREEDRDDVIFFASGVSNSLETDPQKFAREKNLIQKTIAEFPEALFIYFSTCSIYDSSKAESPYVLHKVGMEHLISKSAKQYLILRVSNAVGKGGNQNLLMNYLFRSVKNGDTINIHSRATRNLIDSEDVRQICLNLISDNVSNKVINVAYLHEMKISEILNSIESLSGIKAIKKIVESGNNYHIYLDYARDYFQINHKAEKSAYLESLITKYYL